MKETCKGNFKENFRRFARITAESLGSSWAFAAALLVVVAWAALGPHYAYSDTWQLAINTGTTIVTFLMVFLIQNTQNRDAKAIHLKLDELIRGVKGARTALMGLEQLTDDELGKLQERLERVRVRAAVDLERQDGLIPNGEQTTDVGALKEARNGPR